MELVDANAEGTCDRYDTLIESLSHQISSQKIKSPESALVACFNVLREAYTLPTVEVSKQLLGYAEAVRLFEYSFVYQYGSSVYVSESSPLEWSGIGGYDIEDPGYRQDTHRITGEMATAFAEFLANQNEAVVWNVETNELFSVDTSVYLYKLKEKKED